MLQFIYLANSFSFLNCGIASECCHKCPKVGPKLTITLPDMHVRMSVLLVITCHDIPPVYSFSKFFSCVKHITYDMMFFNKHITFAFTFIISPFSSYCFPYFFFLTSYFFILFFFTLSFRYLVRRMILFL